MDDFRVRRDLEGALEELAEARRLLAICRGQRNTEIETLRREYNAAIANGLLGRARVIGRRMSAMERNNVR